MTFNLSAGFKRIHVFGGTSDALTICRALERHNLCYSLSVATSVGEELACGLRGEIVAQRMTSAQMAQWFSDNLIDCVIDATHPFAAEVSLNAQAACQQNQVFYVRFERQDRIDTLDHPSLLKVDDLEQACSKATLLGDRILLTTGSKRLADYVRLLTDKTLFARVLPTVSVIDACNELGLGVNNIIAMKGPFSEEMNRAMYRFYRPDVVITKESGHAGGYGEKVRPCIELGIPCIVIKRPRISYPCVFSEVESMIDSVLQMSL